MLIANVNTSQLISIAGVCGVVGLAAGIFINTYISKLK